MYNRAAAPVARGSRRQALDRSSTSGTAHRTLPFLVAVPGLTGSLQGPMKSFLQYACAFVALVCLSWLPGACSRRDKEEQVPPQRAGDPPRIAARDLFEYRHLQRKSLNLMLFAAFH